MVGSSAAVPVPLSSNQSGNLAPSTTNGDCFDSKTFLARCSAMTTAYLQLETPQAEISRFFHLVEELYTHATRKEELQTLNSRLQELCQMPTYVCLSGKRTGRSSAIASVRIR
uniref:Uncharacterized protein n=1 Tax=Rhodosorus marinus TaxID=101924 RepID=A0A7S0BGM3_9RHOD|mmetsp:Transcript_14543/g.21239  ORF Transcript_14543/g.21239 Transcript_14543/m.21239 type:complete len:113 (+) Transcript_14543:322-660(+)